MPSSPFQRLWKFISYVSQLLGHFWLPFICLAVWIYLAESNKLPKQMNGNQKWPSNCETYEINFHRRWKGDDGIYFGYRFWFHCLYEQNGLFFFLFFFFFFFWSFFHASGVFGIWLSFQEQERSLFFSFFFFLLYKRVKTDNKQRTVLVVSISMFFLLFFFLGGLLACCCCCCCCFSCLFGWLVGWLVGFFVVVFCCCLFGVFLVTFMLLRNHVDGIDLLASNAGWLLFFCIWAKKSS